MTIPKAPADRNDPHDHGDAAEARFPGNGVAPHPDLDAALREARRRGRLRAREILDGEEMLDAREFAYLLGASRGMLDELHRNREVLGLSAGAGGLRYPAWQLGADGVPFAVMPALFERLGGAAWTVHRFLVQSHPELDGLTGREALRRGMTDEVLEVADGISHGTFA